MTRHKKRSTLNWIFIGTVALALAFSLTAICGCTDSNGARRTLLNQGYKDIKITGYRWYGCSKTDDFSTGFEATSMAGYRVTGIVCSGWLKGHTIRLD